MKRTATGLATISVILVANVFFEGAASAHLFLWTGPLPALVLLLSDRPQSLSFGESLNVTCQHFRGDVKSLKAGMSTSSMVATGTYSTCEEFGTPVTITPVEYEINAQGSLAVTGKPIVVTFGGTAKCSLKIANGGANGHLLRLTFGDQSGGAQLIHIIVNGIHSIPSGGTCGAAELTNGFYLGLLRMSVIGGTIMWA